VRPDWFLAAELGALHEALTPADDRGLDDQTWRDLELGPYLDALSRHTSIFGRQVLLHRLRSGCAPAASAWQRLGAGGRVGIGRGVGAGSRTTAGAGAAPSPLDAARSALQPLRSIDIEVATLVFGSAVPALPGWVRHLWGVPVAFAAAAGLAAAGLSGTPGALAAGGVLFVAALLVSGKVQIALHGALLQWQRQRRALLALLQAARDVARVVKPARPAQAPAAASGPEADASAEAAAAGPGSAAESLHPLLHDTVALDGVVNRLWRQFAPRWSDRIPALAEYANLLALSQYRRFGAELDRLRAERPALQRVFTAVAGLEADLTLRGHLQHGPATCAAEPGPGRALAFTELVHPLLQPAHPLSLQLDGRGAFITGCNGAGKSTLLRCVGLNIVVAQAFGFCYARAAVLPAGRVFSSLQIEDAPAAATSLYMAELQRARALCAAAFRPGGAVLLVDEIFRGTNPDEALAATAALAQELASGGLLLLASHHRVLAALLSEELQPWCVARSATGVPGLAPGVLTQTNGLAMLADYGFAEATRAKAERVLSWLQAQAAPDGGAATVPLLRRLPGARGCP
jgi:hypothetical protein